MGRYGIVRYGNASDGMDRSCGSGESSYRIRQYEKERQGITSGGLNAIVRDGTIRQFISLEIHVVIVRNSNRQTIACITLGVLINQFKLEYSTCR